MAEDMRNPSPEFRAIASKKHEEVIQSGVVGPHYKKTYAELEQTDPIGFEEFNELVSAELANEHGARSVIDIIAKR